jgi:hypothetical protein
VQGAILGLTGWTLVAATLISIASVLAALWLLIRACGRFGYGSRFTACYVALVGLTEPFVLASQKTRYEFLPVLMLALALWLVSRRSVLLGMFVAALAAEVEPAAVVIGCAVFVVIVVESRKLGIPPKKFLPRVVVGVAAATMMYLLLHPDIAATFHAADWKAVSGGRFPVGFVGSYYVRLPRHLVELAVLVAAIVFSLRRGSYRLLLDWPFLCTVTVAFVAALLGWGNVQYFCFISPFVSLFILQVFFAEDRWMWIIAAILIFTLPQYAYRCYYWGVLHPGFTRGDERQLNAAIVRAAALTGKTSEQANVVGDFEVWHAHPDHFVNLDTRVMMDNWLPSADVIVCPQKPLDPLLAPQDNYEVTCAQISRIPFHVVETMDIRGHQMEILVPQRGR